MSRTRLSSLSLLALIAVAAACAPKGRGVAAAAAWRRPRARRNEGGAGGRGRRAPGHGGREAEALRWDREDGQRRRGCIVIGIPQPGSPGTVFPGGGPTARAARGRVARRPAPTSVRRSSGVCATSATRKPTGTTSGSICFYGPITTTTTTTTSRRAAATIEYLHETAGGQEYYRFRISSIRRSSTTPTAPTRSAGGRRGTRSRISSAAITPSCRCSTARRRWSRCSTSTTSPPTRPRLAPTARWASAAVRGRCWWAIRRRPRLDDVAGSQPQRLRLLQERGLRRRLHGRLARHRRELHAQRAAPNWDYRVVYEVWVDAARVRGQGLRRRQHHLRPRVAVEGEQQHRQ